MMFWWLTARNFENHLWKSQSMVKIITFTFTILRVQEEAEEDFSERSTTRALNSMRLSASPKQLPMKEVAIFMSNLFLSTKPRTSKRILSGLIIAMPKLANHQW